jgi:hypothetical protein
MGMIEYRRLKERFDFAKKTLRDVQVAMSGHGLVDADDYEESADTIYGLCDELDTKKNVWLVINR